MPNFRLPRCEDPYCNAPVIDIGMRRCYSHATQDPDTGSSIHATLETVTVAQPRRESYTPLTPLGVVGMGYAELIDHSWFNGQFCCRHCCRKCQAVYLMSSTHGGRDGATEALRAAESTGQAWQTSAGVRWGTVSARLNSCTNTARHPEDEDGQANQG